MQPHLSSRTSPGVSAETLIPLMPVSDLQLVIGDPAHQGDLREALSLADLPADLLDNEKGFLRVDEVWRLFSSLIYVRDDELLGQASQPYRLGSLELLMAYVLHAKTFAEALHRFETSAAIMVPDMRVRVYQRHRNLHLHASFANATAAQQIYLEIACIPWHFAFSWMTQTRLPMTRFISAPQRADVSAQLSGTFGCPASFDGEGIDLVYSADLASLAVQPVNIDDFRQGIFDYLNEQLRIKHQSINTQKVTDYVIHALRSGVTLQADVASSLGMSVATLRRRLLTEGRSFRDLLEATKCEDALQLLQAGHCVDSVAEDLGFSDGRSFRRAFKRHFAQTPAQYRQALSKAQLQQKLT